VLDADQLVDGETGEPGAGIQENIVIYQQAGGEALAPADPSCTSKYLQSHFATPGSTGQCVVCGALRYAAKSELITLPPLLF